MQIRKSVFDSYSHESNYLTVIGFPGESRTQLCFVNSSSDVSYTATLEEAEVRSLLEIVDKAVQGDFREDFKESLKSSEHPFLTIYRDSMGDPYRVGCYIGLCITTEWDHLPDIGIFLDDYHAKSLQDILRKSL